MPLRPARFCVPVVLLLFVSAVAYATETTSVEVRAIFQPDADGDSRNPAGVQLGYSVQPSPLPQVGCVSTPCDLIVLPSQYYCGGRSTTVIRKGTITYYVIDTITGQPVPNCTIQLTLAPYDGSGGHCHSDPNRPVGTIVAASGCQSCSVIGNVANGNTGPDGLRFRIQHTWPDISGTLQAQISSSCPAPSHTFYLCVGVSGLIDMPTGSNYVLTGGADNVSRHPLNHFAFPDFIATLQGIATDFNTTYPAAKLGFNDMSLPWGGVFDAYIAGIAPRPPDWIPPHCGHRNGSTCDIETNGFKADRIKRLQAIVKAHGLTIHTETSHLHVGR